jgi:16S rRNA (uracil1498-N3)-methyltransferase
VTPPLFFADGDALRSAAVGDVVLLDGAEGRHAAIVRRLTVGERLDLSDAAGLVCQAEVAAVRGQAIEARVLSRAEVPRLTPLLTVVQALAKGDRDERAVETMTEAGVDVIVPWQASRSVVRWDIARAAKGVARWRSTAREAAKQSRRAWAPEIAELETTAGVVRRISSASGSSASGSSASGTVFILHEAGDQPLARVSFDAAAEVVLIVGPEGGISDDELASFVAAGASAVRLGPTVLRTSTAGTVAAAVVFAASGRWSAAI